MNEEIVCLDCGNWVIPMTGKAMAQIECLGYFDDEWYCPICDAKIQV